VPDAGHCQAVCDLSCLTCMGGGANGCTQCFDNAHLAGGPTSACVCDLMTFPTPTSRVCTGCHASCATCIGVLATKCLTCHPNASRSTTPGECTCNSPFMPAPDARFCVTCDLSCLTCSLYGVNGCTTCEPFAFLAGPAPSTCVCKLGYFMGAPSWKCRPCSTTCQSCAGSTASQCTACYTNAALISTPPSACACLNRHYPLPSVNNCLPCSAQCGNCQDSESNQCLSCNSHASLQGTAPTSCLCDSGYYLHPTLQLCAACDPTCFTCSFSDPNACLSCSIQAELRSLPPSMCVCRPGFQPSPTSANCIPLNFCHLACFTCETPFQDGCLSCKFPSVLQGNGPARCICPVGYYGSPAACFPCHPTCSSCASPGPLACTGCRPRADLTGYRPSMCRCEVGTYPDPDSANCRSCPDLCKICSEKVCAECIERHYMSTSGSCMPCATVCSKCTSELKCTDCLYGYFLTTTGHCQTCGNCDQPLVPQVTSPYDHLYKIEFNRAVLRNFTESDFSVETDPVTAVNWTIAPGSELLLRIKGGPWANNTLFTLSFTNVSEVVDAFGNALSVSEVSLQPPLHATTVPSTPESSKLTTPTSPSNPSAPTGLVAVYLVLAVSALPIALSAGSVSLAFPLLAHFSLCSYLGSIGPSNSASAYLQAMNFNAIYHRIVDITPENRLRRLYDDQLTDQYYHTATLPASLLACLLLCHCLLRLLALLKVKSALLIRGLGALEWSPYIYYMGLFSLDLSVTSLSALVHGSVSVADMPLWTSTVAAFFCLCLIFLFTLLASFCSFRRTPISCTTALMSNLRKDQAAVSAFYSLNLVHRLLFAAFLVLLQGNFLIQTLLCAVLHLGYFLYVTIVQPYELLVVRRLHIVAEMDVFGAILILVIRACGGKYDGKPLEWLFFAFLLKSVLFYLLIPIFGLISRYSPLFNRLFQPYRSPILPINSPDCDKTPHTLSQTTYMDSEFTHCPPSTPISKPKKAVRAGNKRIAPIRANIGKVGRVEMGDLREEMGNLREVVGIKMGKEGKNGVVPPNSAVREERRLKKPFRKLL